MFLQKKNIHIQDWFVSDEKFNRLYPTHIRNLSQRHWTPLHIAAKAARFLAVENDVKILDIGSGVGKFCLAAAYNKPNALFYGVEQRQHLLSYAEAAKEILQLQNVSFLHGNFTQLDFANFDHFYFYNSFYENLAGTDKIDESIAYSAELYHYYNRYLYRQLDKTPSGTKLVTYHSLEDEIPPGFHTVESEFDSLLKCWIRE